MRDDLAAAVAVALAARGIAMGDAEEEAIRSAVREACSSPPEPSAERIPVFTFDPTGDDVNTGKKWSEQDDADLQLMLKKHSGVSTIATFLCRTEREVRDRAHEFGHELGRGTGATRQRKSKQT